LCTPGMTKQGANKVGNGNSEAEGSTNEHPCLVQDTKPKKRRNNNLGDKKNRQQHCHGIKYMPINHIDMGRTTIEIKPTLFKIVVSIKIKKNSHTYINPYSSFAF
jgi:hypothetical protein